MAISLKIREMTSDDHKMWIEMYAQLFLNATRRGMEQEVNRVLAAPNRAAYCAEQDGQIVGFAEYCLREFANGCISKPIPFLEGIWVSPKHRRKGIAAALITHLEGIARDQGFTEFGSDVLLENKGAIEMHTRLGFEETERVVYFRKPI